MEISLKYIDLGYTIRSVLASPHDSAFCLLLGHCAVHADMRVIPYGFASFYPASHLLGRDVGALAWLGAPVTVILPFVGHRLGCFGLDQYASPGS